MAFDTRVSVEERYSDRYAPASDSDRRDYDRTNFSIDLFGWLVVLSGIIGLAMIVIATIEHVNR
jgi:hypothetical protein